MGLIELHEHARPPQHWAGDPRGFSDYGLVPGDVELADEIDAGVYDDEDQDDEQAGRFHKMLQADAGQRKPRPSWSGIKQRHNRNPGVELPGITRERTERYEAGQAAIQRRLRNNPRQPQDRHNGVTRDVVSVRGTESRRLNHARAAADPRPVWQRQEFSFHAESVSGGPYRSGRPAGQRSTHADYSWRMEDGFRF